MKKILLMMMALCAVAFVGCDKDDENGGGSLVVEGVNLVGMWVDMDDVESDRHSEVGMTDGMIVFTANTYAEYMVSEANLEKWDEAGIPDTQWGFKFKDGYFYGCTKDDFEPLEFEQARAEVIDGKLYIAGIAPDIKIFDKDNIGFGYWDRDGYTKYQRVKGFK